MKKVSTIGLDLAKNVFQAHGADASGAVIFRKKLRRAQVSISVSIRDWRSASKQTLSGF